MAAADEFHRLLADLLAVAPPVFVAERRRLVDTLKSAGRKAEAREIAKVVKPSVPVWVVNQLARQEGPLVGRLGALTADLRRAPLAAPGPRTDGGETGSSDYARVLGAHRDALKALRAAAEKVLIAAGMPANPHTLERVVHNLRAGTASEETRAAIESGRLLHEVGEQDFASLLGPGGAARDEPPARTDEPQERREPRAPRSPPAGDKAPRDHQAAAHAQEAERKQAALAQEVARAEAARERTRARDELAAARERARARAAAERTSERLRAQVAVARKDLLQAERALESARQTLADSERRTDKARREAEALGRALVEAEAAAHALAPVS